MAEIVVSVLWWSFVVVEWCGMLCVVGGNGGNGGKVQHVCGKGRFWLCGNDKKSCVLARWLVVEKGGGGGKKGAKKPRNAKAKRGVF